MANAKTVSIGIVGLGWPGQRHAEGVLAWKDDGVVLYGAADSNEERLAAFAKEYSPEKTFTSLDDMLRDPKLDAVVICLPNALHYPATVATLRAGKHVLCEKPPTLHTEEMRRIEDEVHERGLVYAFSRQMRFHGRARAARHVVESGRLGRIYHARSYWVRSRGIPVGVGGWFLDKSKSGGGVLIDIGIHALDAAWHLMGAPRPVTVSAKVDSQFKDLLPSEVYCDVEDVGFAFVRFANEAVLSLEVSWAGNLSDEVPELMPGQREKFYTMIYGSRASLRLEPLTLFEDQKGRLVDIPLEAEEGNGFAEQIENFVAAIRTGAEPMNNARQGLYLMEMLDAMYESSATRREVLIPD